WSEFDGQGWTSHFPKELAGTPTTAVMAHRGHLWLGTQGRGLAEVELATGAVSIQDERNGLPDDWITCLGRMGDRVLAGTFVGGLAWQQAGTPALLEGGDRGKWRAVTELAGEN